MIPVPPISKRTYTLFPSTTLLRSHRKAEAEAAAERREEAVGNRRRRRSAPHGARSPVASMAASFSARSAASQALRNVDRSWRSEEHTSELQSLMRSSYAVFCLKKKTYKYYTYKQERNI